jgi:hypothetical protein
MGILDSIFDFAGSSKGLVSILAALASAKDRERDRPPTGGGVSYAMPGPRRLQAVKNLGRYTDVMGLANGGTADEEEAINALLYGIAQGPYGPLLAYDIPELNLAPVAPVAPKPEEPRATQPTQSTFESSYEIPEHTGPVGTYNQQIHDALTNLAAAWMTTSPVALAGKGLHAGAEYLLGKTLNEMSPMAGDGPIESRQGTPVGQIGTRGYDEYERSLGFAPSYALTPEEMNAIFSGGSYAEMAAPYSGDSSMGSSAPGGDDGRPDGGTVGGYESPDGGTVGGYESPDGDTNGGPSPFAQGGPVRMEDGGFVLTKRAVDGAGGPRGLAAALPQARMIRGPGTGTSDSIPATISGPRGQTPARVSNGEAYVPRHAVEAAGGPKRMYGLMSALERRA